MRDYDDAESIFEICNRVNREITSDFGGGSPISKTFVMCYLVQMQNLKKYLDIGVYKGRSLFPVAYSISQNKGKSTGVDPYNLDFAFEDESPEEIREEINLFLKSLDFEDIYKDVLIYKAECGYGSDIELVRTDSNSFFKSLTKKNKKFDIIHIDGNHDTKFVNDDYLNSIEHLEQGGFIVFDDINWSSVRIVYEIAKQTLPVIFETENFGILLFEKPSIKRELKIEELTLKLIGAQNRVNSLLNTMESNNFTISVGVLTFNQVKTIEECLDSICSQVGDFRIKIVIADDSSTDGTSELIQDYISRHSSQSRIAFEYFRNEKKIGVMKNLQKLMENLQDSAYFTFCEGDDYYFTINRLKLHLEQHQKNPELAITFNNLIILEEINGKTGYVIWDLIGGPERISTHMLAENNLVGNLGCIFVNSLCLENIEPKLFEMFSGDWFLSLFFSKFGALGFIDKPLSLYRKNGKGFWTGKNQDEKNKFLYDEIEKYDHFFQYSYSKEFTAYKKRLERESNFSIPTTVAVVDDISPHPISAFRYEEFSSILNEIDGSVLLSSGESCHVLGPDKIDELIIDFKRKNPKLATQVGKFNNQEKVQASLLYCVFVGNVHKVLQIAEAEKTPFVFTLYPGGLFGLNNRESDLALRRFMSSPQFMKVIVTNRVTENYLLEKNFCSPDKIEYIWGVVSPRGKLNLEPAKIRYGLDKTDLDICFVAHKYTSDGRDKGFDVFLQMAKLISITRTNVKFHVVGPWDENDYDTGGIRNINFYGVAEQGWFDTFYIDKDLIVSPNASGQIFKGSFDGFPTASVTDAAMRKVAMMVTDPMGLNDDNFEDGKDVLITSNDPTELVANLEFLLDNPSFLTSIAEAGYKKANYLYSVEKQIHPRIEILKNCLAEIEFNQQSEKVDNPRNGFQIEGNEGIHAPLEATGASFQSILYNFIRRMTPRSIKRAIRKVMRVWVIIRGL